MTRAIDPFDPLYPNHWETTDPMVRKTRIYEGHRIVVTDPYNFWAVISRVDGKPLYKSLVGCQFTSFEVIVAAINDAIRKEAA